MLVNLPIGYGKSLGRVLFNNVYNFLESKKNISILITRDFLVSLW